MKILGVIPARYASTRFPAKLLKKVEDKTIIQMVYEQCLMAKSLDRVVVATDNDLIFDHVTAFGGDVVMTSEKHNSGTERCAEVAKIFHASTEYEFIINIQGDEPLINPDIIDSLGASLDTNTEVVSICKKIDELQDLLSSNIVKVVLGESNQALYFSRAPIPHMRSVEIDHWLNNAKYYKHLGIYGYRLDILEKIVKCEPSLLEEIEKLEQLRWLANGFKISMVETFEDSIGIDSPEDLERLRQFIKDKKRK
jgi:3-deoxy-manno-octulosonate cytidylyltransferase (CMP-KDO synthetase)